MTVMLVVSTPELDAGGWWELATQADPADRAELRVPTFMIPRGTPVGTRYEVTSAGDVRAGFYQLREVGR